MGVKQNASSSRLGEYRRKRAFDETPEPGAEPEAGPESAAQTKAKPEPDGDAGVAEARFVVHEHHARSLHWDLRLERDGALVSWAIPKGIPPDPKSNRLAVHVEDHPLSYIDFAGEIPVGSYGAGEVRIWDAGTYETHKFRNDEVIVTFHGKRLRGKYVLFQTKGKNWMIHRMDPPQSEREAMPERLVPMLAKLSSLPANDEDYGYEIKWDGIRALAFVQGGRMRLENRNGRDVSKQYPELRALGEELGSREAILDGEIVALDEHGRPSFARLQQRMHVSSPSAVRRLASAAPVSYMIFDLLYLDGRGTMGLPYRERRVSLEELDLRGPAWQTPAYHAGEGRELLAAAAEQHLEGVLAKRLDSRYLPGKRSGEWLKIKNVNRQELVIGGWLPGKGSRAGRIGALLMGYYEPDGPARDHRDRKGGPDRRPQVLRYAGRVGTGFKERDLELLGRELQERSRDSSPFTGTQPPRGARFVEPQLVAEIEFAHWTDDRILRHSAYKGLRDDKPASAVVREQEQPADPSPVSAGEGALDEREIVEGRTIVDGRETVDEKAILEIPAFRALIDAGRRVSGGVEIEVEGRTLKLTNLEKVLYPTSGFTKGDLIGYYAQVAPVLLAHLHDRPLTLKRYPNGVREQYFYEKQSPRHRPDWVATTTIYSEHSKREIHYILCQDLPTLLWLANLAAIELHPSLSRAQAIARPTTLAFDLDPGAPANIVECCEVALELREMFDQLGLSSFAKTSGSKGLQVYVPLGGEDDLTYEQTKPFAHAVADLFERRRPELVVSQMAKKLRPGKVLIDWSQNDEHKTTVSVYSLRAKERPTVSTPLDWEEVQSCRERGEEDLLVFDAQHVLERVAKHGDRFAEVLSLRQALPAL
jgi:bifunctional non-homologous end joining protein LigD